MIPPDPRHTRLVSYNMRKAMGTDRRRDPERVLKVVIGTHPDIVVLQEADMRLGQRPSVLRRVAIADARLRALDFDETHVSLGWHGNAMLLRSDWQADRLSHIDLPGLEPRGAIAADLIGPHGPLRVIGVHLGLLRRSRHAQQRAILAWLDKQPAMPTLIAGDMNEWSPVRGLETLAQRFDLHAPGPSFHARLRLAALDRIGLSQGLELCASGMVDTPLSRRASDHLPVYADIAHEPGVKG